MWISMNENVLNSRFILLRTDLEERKREIRENQVG